MVNFIFQPPGSGKRPSSAATAGKLQVGVLWIDVLRVAGCDPDTFDLIKITIVYSSSSDLATVTGP